MLPSIFVFVISLITITTFQDVFASKLNARRVLLPYNIGVPTNFTLEVNDGGCYQWSSSRPDVAVIHPIYPPESPDILRSCSKSAKVTVTSHSPRRLSSIVMAREVDTGLSNRVDIEVDVIKSIEIITRTKEIALDDVPEIIEVRAMNAEKDTFSSLGGIEFEWILEPLPGANQARNNLRFKKFSESSYRVTPDIEHWESRDSHGSVVLIQGTKTGSSKVGVKIKDPVYKNVKPAEITLIVIANLILLPSHNIYLIPFGTVKYNIELIKSGESHPLLMPSDQYYLEITNKSVANLNPETATVTAIGDGETELVLKDRNIKQTDGVRQPTAEIYIRRPSYLTISVNPGGNFALQEQTVYIIDIQIFDDYHHRIYSSDNLDLQVEFPSKYFKVEFQSPNGTYSVIKTLLSGSCKIKAKLIGAFNENREVKQLSAPLELTQEVKIYPKLTITPSSILLPWDPIVRPSYILSPTASGATGYYHWESSDPSVAVVTFRGESKESSKAKVKTNTFGKSSIIVTDTHNSVFREALQISIQPVDDIEVVANVLETQLGSSVFLPLALYGFEDDQKKKRRVFDDCSKMPIDVEVIEKGRFSFINSSMSKEEIPSFGRGCKTLRFDCLAPGHSRIFLRYKSGDNKINLQTTTIISCHLPLKLVHPPSFGLLALGTSIELAFEGGPRMWPSYKEGHYIRLSPRHSNLFETSLIADPYRFKKDLHVFKATCKNLGETDLELSIGNLASPTLPNPAVETILLKLACAAPESLHLRPKLKADENCPLIQALSSGSSVKLPISSTRESNIEIFARDEKGRKFYNISSLSVAWRVSDHSLAKLTSSTNFVEEINGAEGYRRLTRSYQRIKPVGKEGDLIIEAVSTSYRADSLAHEGIKSYQDLANELKATSLISLVDKPHVEPPRLSILNHRNNKVSLQLQRGSGHFTVELSSNEYASLNYSETSKTASLLPIKNGVFVLKVSDCCVDHGSIGADVKADVRVVSPKDIKMKMLEKLEHKKEGEIVVKVVDNNGGLIPAIYHDLMNLQPNIGSDIITIKRKVQPKAGDEESVFIMRAEKLGKTSVSFSTSSKYDHLKQTQAVTSLDASIQIFVPLKIVPSNLTLIIGSIFQITVVGGPQVDTNLVFKIDDEQIASISASGILNAHQLGSTRLTVSAIGHNSVLHSQDQIVLKVVPLKGIKISHPGSRLLVGSEMPLFISGVAPDDDTLLSPFTFAAANPQLRIRWTVSNRDIVRLKGVLDDSGLFETIEGASQSENMFTVRAHGIQSGSVSIKCSVEVEEKSRDSLHQQVIKNLPLSDEIQLRIYPQLRLLLPSGERDEGLLLMSPGSELHLKSTRQGFASLKYSLRFPSTKVLLDKGNILKAIDVGENILVVTAQEEFSTQQSVAYRVVVKPVSYLMLKPMKTFHRSSRASAPVYHLPVGSFVRFGVNYYDSNGQLFDAALSNLNIRPNRYDLIDIAASGRYENNNLTVKILKEGTTIVRAWDASDGKGNELQDYVYIRSGNAISPSSKGPLNFTLGDIICFKSPLTTPEGQSGIWEIEGDDKTLITESLSGFSLTNRPGKVRVKYNISSFTTSSGEINVNRPQAIHLESNGVEYLTQTGSSFVFPINVVKSDSSSSSSPSCDGDSFDSIFYKRNTPFSCELTLSLKTPSFLNAMIGRDLSPADLFDCQIEFNLIKNINEVHLNPQPFENNLLSALSSVEMDITLTLFLNSHSSDPIMSSSINLPFYPNFHVAQKEIILSDKNTLDFITVSSTPHISSTIQVIYGNEETEAIIDIFPPEEPKQTASLSTKSLFVRQIPIQIRDISKLWQRESNEPLNIKVWSHLLRQTKTVIVKIAWSEGRLCPKLARESSIRAPKQSIYQVLGTIWTFAVEYYQRLLTSIITSVVIIFGYHYTMTRVRQNRAIQPTASSPMLFTPSQKRTLSFQAPLASPSTSSFSVDSPQAASPTSPRVGRPLWSERSN